MADNSGGRLSSPACRDEPERGNPSSSTASARELVHANNSNADVHPGQNSASLDEPSLTFRTTAIFLLVLLILMVTVLLLIMQQLDLLRRIFQNPHLCQNHKNLAHVFRKVSDARKNILMALYAMVCLLLQENPVD
jgi:hypothetical protein